MRNFRDLLIRQKLMRITMLTSSIALLVAGGAFILYDQVTFRQTMRQDLAMLAEIVGSNSTAAIVFHDPKSAREVLGALSAGEDILSACIYTRDGKVFAKYRRGDPTANFDPLPAEADGARIRGNRLVLFRGIRLDGEIIGTVYLESDLRPVWTRLVRFAGLGAILMVVSSWVGLLVTSRLQGLISEPIGRLAWTAKMVTIEKNYSIRAAKQSEDELGMLVEGFNEMLAQIQRRDEELQRHREHLEEEVATRTTELRTVNAQLTLAKEKAE